MGSPAGAGGTGVNGTVYEPAQQPAADLTYQNIIQGLIGNAQNGGAGSPGGVAYPQATSAYAALLDPNTAAAQQALTGAGTAGQYATGTLAPQLQGAAGQLFGVTPQALSAASQILNTGFDPQQALYQQTLNQTTQQAAAQNAASGVGGTPYGQSVADQATNNFNLNWQNQQLAREATAASAYGGLTGAAGNAASQAGNLGSAATSAISTGSSLPYTTGATEASNALQGLSSTVNIGNQQYVLPQQVLNDLQSYLGLGQSASQISGSLGQTGLNELSQAASGIGGGLSLVNGLAGGTSAASGLGGLLGSTGSTSAVGDALGTVGDATVGGSAGSGLLGTIGSLGSLAAS